MFLWPATVGGKDNPGMTFPFKSAVKNEAAFAESSREVLAWDFDRLIVGHGIPIASGAKEKLRSTLGAAGVKNL